MLSAVALFGAACGGSADRPIGIKEYPGDVVFGDQARPAPPPTPSGASLVPAFPGFIAPPAPRSAMPADPLMPTTTTTTLPPVACPEDDPLAVPPDIAGTSVPKPPDAEAIPYRVNGSTTIDGTTTPLPAESAHRISEATDIAPGTFRFNVAIAQAGDQTVTTYQVDQRGFTTGGAPSTDAISIVQIRSENQVATDAFTPSAPVTVLPLPPFKGQRFSSTGADPLHGTSLSISGRVLDKTRVNACGIPLEAWLVEVGPDPQTGLPSAIRGPGRELVITGTYAIAPQFGGLVLSSNLTMAGTEEGSAVTETEASTLNRPPTSATPLEET